MDETANGNFRSKRSSEDCTLCYFVLFISCIWHNLQIETLCSCTQVENSEQKNGLGLRKRNKQVQRRKKGPISVKTKTPLWRPQRLFKQSAWAVCTLICCCAYRYNCWLYLSCCGLFFSLWLLCPFQYLSLQCDSEIENELQCDAFPGNSWFILIDVCGFVKRDNLLAWHELFTNLYELKSRIWFWEEYLHFERIYRECRFDGFSWNFARTFQG